MYFSDGESWVTSPYSFAVGVTKGSGYFLGDLSQGVTKLLTEPGEVWDGVKVLASQPGTVMGRAFMTNVYLSELYGWVGDDAEAMAVLTRFTANTVTAIDGATALPSIAKGTVGLAGDAVNLAKGLARSGDVAADTADLGADAAKAAGPLESPKPKWDNPMTATDGEAGVGSIQHPVLNRVGVGEVTFEGAADPGEFARLNTPDAATGMLRSSEAEAAVKLQDVLGSSLRRANPSETGDFIIEAGPRQGQSVDFMFTADNPKAIANMNKYFPENLTTTISKLYEHLNGNEIVPLDFRRLDPVNQNLIMNEIGTMDSALKSKIIVIK